MTGQVFGTVAEGSTMQKQETETPKASFSLRSHNPDVLTCIANLSSDEVFTPPELANEMLDVLEQVWAESNAGANIWADPSVTFLDPFTKSGVFLREIVKRLTQGLEHAFPDLQQRVDHILTKQVFGIGITQLTSLLARRSVYCSKFANGKHSITDKFVNEAGNIWFERTEHTWVKRKREQRVHPTSGITEMVELEGTGRCEFCGANETNYSRDTELETHAYAFIHTNDIKARLAELFGDNMQFDVIIGNPPYQLSTGGGTATQQARPLYHLFVEQAQTLSPRFVTMVTPSRWFSGGMNLDAFRSNMLNSHQIRVLVDFLDSRDAFTSVDIAGGVSYFLWDKFHKGKCSVTTVRPGGTRNHTLRNLDDHEIFVRDNAAITILEKIKLKHTFKSMTSIVSSVSPFGLPTSFRGQENSEGLSEPIIIRSTVGRQYAERQCVTKNNGLVDVWKILLSATASEHAGQAGRDGTKRVFSRIECAEPGVAMTHSYLAVGPYRNKIETENAISYLKSRFVRFLVSITVMTQHISRGSFMFVPLVDFSKPWSDEELYKMYELSDDEIDFIESQIKPMELSDE